jgi:hypothetical protein
MIKLINVEYKINSYSPDTPIDRKFILKVQREVLMFVRYNIPTLYDIFYIICEKYD